MTVTEILPVSSGKCRIVTDEDLTFVLYRSEAARCGLREHEEIAEPVLAELLGEVLPVRAKKYAMHLLTKADRTEHELREKLRKAGYPEAVIDTAVDYVSSYGYLNDERYALHYTECMQDRMSRQQIRWKLLQKGISREIVAKADAKAETVEPEDVIQHLAEKRLGSKNRITEKDLRSFEGYLARRGFSGDPVWSVLRKYKEQMEE